MLNLNALNSFSRRFADRLFAAYPEWMSFADSPTGGDWDEGVLALQIHSPVSGHRLSIDTDGDEITIGFGEYGWHSHYWAWDGLDESTVFERALNELAAILRDEVAILTRFNADVIGSSETLWEGEETKFGSADRIEIVSWLGTRDATVFPA